MFPGEDCVVANVGGRRTEAVRLSTSSSGERRSTLSRRERRGGGPSTTIGFSLCRVVDDLRGRLGRSVVPLFRVSYCSCGRGWYEEGGGEALELKGEEIPSTFDRLMYSLASDCFF